MINYRIFSGYYDLTPNGTPILKALFDVKAPDPESAIRQAKTKGAVAPIVQPLLN